MNNNLSKEPMYNIQCAWTYPSQEVLWKEVRSIPCKDIQLYCIRAHPQQKAAKVRSQVAEMYPHRILIGAKGVQILQPLYLEGSCKSGHRLWRISIMVRTRADSPQTHQDRFWRQPEQRQTTKGNSWGESDLNPIECSSRASEGPMHILVESKEEQREVQNVEYEDDQSDVNIGSLTQYWALWIWCASYEET